MSNKYEGHTPGPWYAEGVAVYKDIKDQRYCVAEARHWGDETEANARLIADAPALLAHCNRLAEALREMLQEAEAYEEDGTRFDRERNQRARTALYEYEKEQQQ